jgi:hypothetical protein
MGSPFKDAAEYLAATGPYHSFVGHPTSATVVLAISFLLTCYFVVKSFLIHH